MFTVTVVQEIASILDAIEYCSVGARNTEGHEKRLKVLFEEAVPKHYKLDREKSDSGHLTFTYGQQVYTVNPGFGRFEIVVETKGEYPSELEEVLREEYETEWPCDV